MTGEIFSQVLAGAGGRLADAVDAQLRLVDCIGVVVLGQTVFDMATDFHGAPINGDAGNFGSNRLLYSFTLPSTGTFAFRVLQSGAENSGR